MRKLLFILFIGVCSIGVSLGQNGFIEGEIILKVSTKSKDKCSLDRINIPAISDILKQHNFQSQHKIFPNHSDRLSKSGLKIKTDLSTIYRIKFSNNTDLKQVIAQLKKDRNVQYAELVPINKLIYTPSDTQNYRQWYLDAIRAYDAWDINKGDSNITIAIVDTGTDTDHEDLEDNLYKNLNDTINGIDDDNDGYIDNYYGWDVAMNDNDVNPESHGGSSHGSNCAGIASATTDNTLGISGVGFNTKLMTVKIDNPAGQLIGAYEGVVYAADQGVDIMNLSWGSYSYSEFGKDIIDYASENGVLIFAGAGNGPFSGPNTGIGVEDKFYPAAYDNAIAVGATFEEDTIKESSNFGYWLGIFAPGERMWTTFGGGNYGRNGGTSMAAPVVAGCAAIVKSHFPNYSNEQILQKLYNSGDFIEAVNDPKYKDKLGAGRVNLFRALTENNLPGIEYTKIQLSDGDDNSFTNGDTIRINGTFINWLANATNASVQMEVLDQNLEVLNSNLSLGNLSSLDTLNNADNPFGLVVKNIDELNKEINIRFIIIAAGGYERIQYFSFIVNKEILTVTNNDITTTLSSSGSIGYTYETRLGEGITYKTNASQLFEGSFMIGNSENYIANQFRGNNDTISDFKTLELVQFVSSDIAAQKTLAAFNDENLSVQTKVEIRQFNYFFDEPELNDAIIFSYDIKNVSSSNLTNMYAGIILDWDLGDYLQNKIFDDNQRNMGVSYMSDSSLFAGIRALNHLDKVKHYAIDNTGTGEGGVNLGDGFSDAEKFTVVSTNRLNAGGSSQSGNDVIDALSIGPFNLEVDSSYNVSFALIISDNLNDLNTTSDSIYMKFQDNAIGLLENTNRESLLEIYPNPAKENLFINLRNIKSDRINLEIIDTEGRVMFSRIDVLTTNLTNYALDISSLKTGVYLIRLIGNDIQIQNKFVVLAN